MEIKLVRKHIIFKGRVQGVGFRYFCYTEANKMNLTGYVRNLYDGNVEMEVQGDMCFQLPFQFRNHREKPL